MEEDPDPDAVAPDTSYKLGVCWNMDYRMVSGVLATCAFSNKEASTRVGHEPTNRGIYPQHE